MLAGGVALALLLGVLLWAPRPLRAWQVVASALLAYPAARALVGALAVADRLTRRTVLLPASALEFELNIVYHVSIGLLLPLGGALLLWRARAGKGAARSLRDLRAALARVLEPAGLRLAAPGPRALLGALGLLGLVLALQFVALAAQGSVASFLVTGDESRYWLNLTPALLLGLSVSAGVSEEFVYRGLLLRALARRMDWKLAIALQALLFGFIHTGYGNWAHIVGPAIFGALMGVVALRVSLLAAIAIHAGTNVAYLALFAPQLQPFNLVVPVALTLVGLAALAATRLEPLWALGVRDAWASASARWQRRPAR